MSFPSISAHWITHGVTTGRSPGIPTLEEILFSPAHEPFVARLRKGWKLSGAGCKSSPLLTATGKSADAKLKKLKIVVGSPKTLLFQLYSG